MHRCITLGVKHHLCDPCSVAQVDEHDDAMVAPPLDPELFMTVRREIAEPRRETGARSREDPMRTRAVR